MIITREAKLRFHGNGSRLRLRASTGDDSLALVRECCRASLAVEKALGEAVSSARSAGRGWGEIAGLSERDPTRSRDSTSSRPEPSNNVRCGNDSGPESTRDPTKARAGRVDGEGALLPGRSCQPRSTTLRLA
jgi:hypothetical protein